MKTLANVIIILAVSAALHAAETVPFDEPPPDEPLSFCGTTTSEFAASGFIEGTIGGRLRADELQKYKPLSEMRLQGSLSLHGEQAGFDLTAALVIDRFYNKHAIRLGTIESDFTLCEEEAEALVTTYSKSYIDLREANVHFKPSRSLTLVAGRQILTWGTGDLLFINDLFPKDYTSFFIGRDIGYFHAPSDAMRVSAAGDTLGADFVYTPRFNSDHYVDGRRFTYYNARLQRQAGLDAPIDPSTPRSWFRDDEFAARVYHTIERYEAAAYFYEGFWKSPAGYNRNGRDIFPRLNVYGASLQGGLLEGTARFEFGYYDSPDSRSGRNGRVRNSEWRFLTGYDNDEGTILPGFSFGVQYYLELMDDYRNYLLTLDPGLKPRDEHRHVVTLRLTQLAVEEKISLSLFTFYSPSDDDAYLRPLFECRMTDPMLFALGANIFVGRRRDTFYGQYDRASNMYVALRYKF